MEKFGSTEVVIPKGKVLVVSHDAGGAEILSSLLKLNKIPYLLCLAGPAENIFKMKLGKGENYSLEKGIKQANWILTGTSWASNLEYRAICIAKKENIFVSSFLDHWVNYRERFTWHGPEMLPDEIWVGDEDAEKIAKELFLNMPVKLIPNPFWLEVKERVKDVEPIDKKDVLKILFVSSNMDGVARRQPDITFSDYDILTKFLENIDQIFQKREKIYISIRKHPSETLIKYDDFNYKNFELKIDENEDLMSSFLDYTHVAGFESMALVLAKINGLHTINLNMGLPRLKTIPSRYIDHYIL